MSSLTHTELINDYIQNYMGKIFYYCLKKTSDKKEAEELTQEITFNVISALNKKVIPHKFSAWVWQITRNIYSKWAKKQRKNRNNIDINEIDVSDDDDVIEDMIQEEQLTLLRRELAFIKSDYNNIIVAYYFKNNSVKDIATSLSLSEDVIRQRLHRAREILKEGMHMERKFGKRSYNPENISFVMNGRCGKAGQPWSIVSHLLYKNIFLEAYENPQTAEQLSLEIGLALPYMEEELEFLCQEELLKKANGKYETNFNIISKKEQFNTYLKNKKVSKQITSKLCEIIDLYMKEDGSKVNYNYIGYENAKWALLVRTFDNLYYSCHSNSNRTPNRPDNGKWEITGYEFPVEFEKPYFVGGHGYHCEDEKDMIVKIHWLQYKFYVKDLYNKTPEFLTYKDVYTLWLICNDRINECDKGYVEQLLSYGYLKKDSNGIQPNVLIFTEGNEKNKSKKLAQLRNEIMELLKEVPFIERGYIVEQALEDGWLNFDKNTINTVGAYIDKESLK